MALNYIWIGFLLVGFAVATLRVLSGETQAYGQMLTGLFDMAKTGFDISIGLVGVMTLWLGIMRIGEKASVIEVFARWMSPFFKRIFPGIPPGHPAGGSIMMNFSANMLGLDNAATPLGLKAMRELQDINPNKEVASNPMIMFLVLNTAGITLIPSSVIAMRQSMAIEQGLQGFNGADIFLPTLMGTFISFVSGLMAVAWVQRINLLCWPVMGLLGGFAALMGGLYFWLNQFPPAQMAQIVALIGSGMILLVIMLFVAAGAWRRLNVYDTFVEGAKDGFGVAIQIIPYLVAMLAAISVFRSSGCMDFIVQGIGHLVRAVGLDDRFVPALPVGLMKTLSGSGARGLMVDVLKTYGVNSFEGQLASIIQGSTETTFYVLAVYFGSVNIRQSRHALACALFADLVGLIGAIAVAYLFFG